MKKKANLTPAATSSTEAVVGYADFLRDNKTCIQTALIKAALAVNRELVLLYWNIGRDL